MPTFIPHTFDDTIWSVRYTYTVILWNYSWWVGGYLWSTCTWKKCNVRTIRVSSSREGRVPSVSGRVSRATVARATRRSRSAAISGGGPRRGTGLDFGRRRDRSGFRLQVYGTHKQTVYLRKHTFTTTTDGPQPSFFGGAGEGTYIGEIMWVESRAATSRDRGGRVTHTRRYIVPDARSSPSPVPIYPGRWHATGRFYAIVFSVS